MRINPVIKEDLKRYFKEVVAKLHQKLVVTSAYPLSEVEKQLILSKLPSFVASASMSYVVDPNIIAGVVINVGSKVIDLSIRGQLQKLRTLLYEST